MDILWTLIQSVFGAMALNRDTYEALQTSSDAELAATIVVILAGASILVGQSVALFLNKTRPWRFALSMLVTGLVYVIAVAFSALSIAIAATLLGQGFDEGGRLVATVSLGQAPLILGFLALTPYVGPRLLNGLEIWAFLSISVGVQVNYGVNPAEALLITFAGWIVGHLLRITIGRPIQGLDAWAVRKTAGVDKGGTAPEQALSWFRERARSALGPDGER